MKTNRINLRDERGQGDFGLLIGIVAGISYGVYYFGSTEDSATNENCLIYSGGTFDDKTFVGVMPAGKTKYKVGWGSKTKCYKIDQRSYVGKAGYDPNVESEIDAPAVQVVGAPSTENSGASVRLNVDYQLYFTLNRDVDVLRQFHEKVGVKTDAWTDDGWREMLKTYFEPQIERAMEAAALEFQWDDLYANEETRREFQARTIENLKRNMTEVVGGDYFCSPSYNGGDDECGDFTFTVGKPVIASEDLIKEIEAGETAARAAANQETRNERVRSQLEADRDLVEVWGSSAALIEAIRSGKVQQIIVAPDGTVSAVPTPPAGG